MKKEKIIKKSYKILSEITPLKTDCGNLCDCCCCKGDNETGMLLFPGEEELYINNSDFILNQTSDGKNLIICKGKCNRDMRPLSCRIFPLVPVCVDNRCYVIDDPRAKGICPLLYDEMTLDKKFEKAVIKFGKLLMKNEETRVFLNILTNEITDILSMQQTIF